MIGKENMTSIKKSLVLILIMTGAISGTAMSMSTDIELSGLPKPTQTVASSNTSAVEEIGQPQSFTIERVESHAAAKPKVAVVELFSEYVSKKKAIDYLALGKYTSVISYAVTGVAGTSDTSKLSENLFYYLNRDTHRIGIAINKDAARELSHSANDVFSAKEGETLKQTLTRWSKKSGYKIEWLSDYDYELKYSYEFVGRLIDKFGPLNQVLTSISGSNYALKALITENNVILIKDNDYSPSILGQ